MKITVDAVVTSLSVSIAIVVYCIGYLERRRIDKRHKTVTILNSLYADSSMENARTRVARMIYNAEKLTSDDVSPSDDRYIIQLLDFYEFVCRLAYGKDINRRLVVDLRGGAMRAAYLLLERYIQERRERLGRPNLYQFFERFVLSEIGDKAV